MKLRHVEITGYRSIQKASFPVRADITVMVGTNESGKSNILRAIELFNAGREFEQEDAAQPSPLSEKTAVLPSVALTFGDFSEEEKQSLGDLIREPLVGGTPPDEDVIVAAEAEKQLEVQTQKVRVEELQDQLSVLTPLLEAAETDAQDRREELPRAQETYDRASAAYTADPTPIRQYAVQTASAALADVQYAKQRCEEHVTELATQRAKLQKELEESLDALTRLSGELEQLSKGANELNATAQPGEKAAGKAGTGGNITIRRVGGETPRYEVVTAGGDCELEDEGASRMLALLPRIVTLSGEDLLDRTVELAELEGADAKHRAMRSLLSLGGIEEVGELSEPSRRPELLERAQERVARYIRQKWTQDQTVGIRLDVDDRVLRLSFKDSTGATVPPARRSLGFLEHVSLHLMLLASLRSKELSNCIVLVDGLGTELHPEGQKDFLALLGQLASDNQVLYTTHSPFMVDRNFPDRIALVQKEAQTGTTVDATVHQRAWVPLRSALGLALGDWLLLAEKNVLVAKLSDQYMLIALARAFSHLGVTRLDLNDTSFLAVGGACGMMRVSQALEGRAKVKCVVALDSDERGYAEQQRLSKAGFPIEHILCAGDFIEEPGAVTLGDLAPAKLYLEAARRCSKHVGEGDWLPGELDPNRPVVEQLSKAIEERSGHGLDKVAVAVELAQMLRTDPSLAKEGDGEAEKQPIVRLIGGLGELLEGQARAKVEEKYGFVRAEVRKERESFLMQARGQLQLREKATVADKERETAEHEPESIAADQAP